ncbi:MAG: hypothetical protein JWM11_1262 [Planctomycetaceae bacterium]|nr:hypothetical protein [Planctomycetaceae bacterium]
MLLNPNTGEFSEKCQYSRLNSSLLRCKLGRFLIRAHGNSDAALFDVSRTGRTGVSILVIAVEVEMQMYGMLTKLNGKFWCHPV